MYIFHHLPKCGGTSIVSIIDQWFIQVRDYQDWGEDAASFDKSKLDLSKYDERHCLCGHFEREGIHLHQRYPEVINNPVHRMFTFIRDPLELKCSLYYFLKGQNKIAASSELNKHVMNNPNYIAGVMGCDIENFRTILDRFFFIGLTEELQKSVDCLARMIGRPSMTVPVLNTSPRHSKAQEMNDAEIAHFKEINYLDYAIYEYCQQRFISQIEQL